MPVVKKPVVAKKAPTISIHPAASVFPMLSDDELKELANSIKLHGLREPIQAIPHVREGATDWEVLDGRNRLEALRRFLKVPDSTIIAEYMKTVNPSKMFATPSEYVMMANIERRNLTAPQRKALAGKLVLMIQAEQKAKPKAEKVNAVKVAAEKAGVSPRTAASAAAVAKGKKPAVVKKPVLVPRPVTVIANLKAARQGLAPKELTKWTPAQLKEALELALLIWKTLENINPA